jgi:hypothetical protein
VSSSQVDATTTPTEPQVAIDGRGDEVVVWQTANASHRSGMGIATLNQRAHRWFHRTLFANGGVHSPTVAVNGDGAGVVGWITATGSVAIASIEGWAGELSRTVTVAAGGRSAPVDLTMEVLGDGRAMLSWAEADRGIEVVVREEPRDGWRWAAHLGSKNAGDIAAAAVGPREIQLAWTQPGRSPRHNRVNVGVDTEHLRI